MSPYAPLAQLAEHLTLNQAVRGSNPWWRTYNANNDKGLQRCRSFVVCGHSLGATPVLLRSWVEQRFPKRFYKNWDNIQLMVYVST